MISVCMIVKNEEKLLSKCLTSIRNHLATVVDEIIVVDTGSDDDTVNIAKNFGCKVFAYEWCDDFSKVRNYSVGIAKNKWVLVLDADEYIEEVNIDELLEIIKRAYNKTIFSINVKSINKNNEIMSVMKVNRFYNKEYNYFLGVVHEQVTPNTFDGATEYDLNMSVLHTGYSDDIVDNKNKIERNKTLIKKHLETNPSDMYMVGQLGLTYAKNNEFEEAIQYLEQVVFNEKCVNTPYYILILIGYLKILSKLEKYEAIVICENLWEYGKQSNEYFYLLGFAYLKTNRIEDAVNCFITLINTEEGETVQKKNAYYFLGQIFEEFEEYEQAIVCFKNCIDFMDSRQRLDIIESKIKS